MVYRYYTIYRPPSPGVVPHGFVAMKVWGSRPYVEEIGHTAWGTVDYASPLSQQEIRDYELAPANMVQKPVATAIERSEQNGLHELARDAG